MRNTTRICLTVIAIMMTSVTNLRASEEGAAPVMLQHFEATWETIERRAPDIFMAGYESMWLPPPQRGASGTASVGYDLFDRFDLGTDDNPTRYGSERSFRSMIRALHRAGVYVYVDWLMNHNAALDNLSGDPFIFNGQSFLENGGYAGFALELPTDPFGDFHAPGTQSENPGEPNYNVFEGRLVGLIDIDHDQLGPNYSFIRHPIEADPDNIPIPPTAVRNQPDPNNRRFYPDLDLPPANINNPGAHGNPGGVFTVYPFNTSDPMAGDPVLETAQDLLLRSTQYYLEVLGVDGFRLDAAKHIETAFWDSFWDVSVHNRHTRFDGTVGTAFSFVEATGGGPGIDPFNYTRKDSFADRDALDLEEAGALRNQVDNPDFTSWQNALNASIDNRDFGLNNGSLGVHHVSSHDNANAGDNMDTTAHAYVLLRSGLPLVYHNAFQFGAPSLDNFPRRNGRDDALGLGSDAITTIVKIHNQYVRGRFDVLNGTDTVNPSLDDILVMEHNRDLGGTPGEANILVFLNDKQSFGQDATDFRSVQTHFSPGTRLHELTGNAANPIVDVPSDPDDDLEEVIVVGGDQRVLVKTPRNRNSDGVNHGRGYLAYGPAVPAGTLSITGTPLQLIPPDSVGVPPAERRLSFVQLITTPTFELRLNTTQADALDPNTDDLAIFRFDAGFEDHNGNGSVDYFTPGAVTHGFENFLTESSPLFGGGTGTYRQTIDAAALGEGFHYITVRAFRHRSGNTDPLFAEFRKVIYVDIEDPDFQVLSPSNTCSLDVTEDNTQLVIAPLTDDVDRLVVFVDLLDSTNFVAQAFNGGGTQAESDVYTGTYSVNLGTLSSGNHRIDIVAIEDLPNGSFNFRHETYPGVQANTGNGLGPADMNSDGSRDGRDIIIFQRVATGVLPIFSPRGDINCDGVVDTQDIPGFVDLLLE